MNNQQVLDATVYPDSEVIDRVVNGEKNLYAIIVRRYNQRLYRTGMAILNDDTDVEDAMQVAYINAWQSLGKFKFKSSFATWLTRIMVNECLLRLKKRKHFLEINEEVSSHSHLNGSKENAVSKLMNTELKNALELAIRSLPEKYRTVFILRELENLSVAETKDCLAISEINVKVRLNRAKSMLRNSLGSVYRSAGLLQFHLSRCDKMVEKVMDRIIY